MIKYSFTFGEEAGVFRWGDSEFIVETMVPDFSHIVPVVDDTVLDGVVELENAFFGLSLFSNVDFFIVHANHNVVVFGSSNN